MKRTAHSPRELTSELARRVEICRDDGYNCSWLSLPFSRAPKARVVHCMHANPVLLTAAAVVVLAGVFGCNPPMETIPAPPSSGTTWSSGTTGASGTTSSGLPGFQSGTTWADESHAQSEPSSVASREVASGEVVLDLASYDQLQATIARFAGKVVVVDIWSTSCLPCMQEFHHLVELSKKYPERVACVSMNVDYIGLKRKPAESYLPRIKAFLVSQKATLTNLAASETDEAIREKCGIGSIPATMIYDSTGNLVQTLTASNSGGDGLSYLDDVIPVVEELAARRPTITQ